VIGPKYLVRFDDICSRMNWQSWENIEAALLAANIRPILAIVPDNRDAKLNVSSPKLNFWQRVRDWQQRGWAIAIHGYQHVYDSPNGGIIGLNAYSEFAGLPYDVQRSKLLRAIEIFDKERISPDAWIAPAHSFDETTVRVLRESGIRVVSDGFYLRPQLKMGMIWVPQQLWRFRQMPTGLWTVCFHHNHWSDREFEQFRSDLARFRAQIVSLRDVVTDTAIGPVTIFDEAFAYAWRAALKLKARGWA
jgi:predicted deacetylase